MTIYYGRTIWYWYGYVPLHTILTVYLYVPLILAPIAVIGGLLASGVSLKIGGLTIALKKEEGKLTVQKKS
jgi:hypothetical protein